MPKTKSTSPKIGAAQIRLLERLSNACAVSGDEGEVRKIVLEEIRPHADEVKIDALGSVLALKRGLASGVPRLKVMLAAHMDEVGFMIIQDEGDGIYRFDTVGGLDERQLVGKSVLVGKDHLSGVIGAKAVHLTRPEERKTPISLDVLRIDVGPGSNKIKIGDWAVFATRFQRLGPSLVGKALDNRLGVATLVELLKHAPPNIDLLAAFTVQEELGLRGARGAAYSLDPDLAIAIDSTPANDLPLWDGRKTPPITPAWVPVQPCTLPIPPPSLTRAWCATWRRPGMPWASLTSSASQAAAARTPAPSTSSASACPACPSRCQGAMPTPPRAWLACRTGSTPWLCCMPH